MRTLTSTLALAAALFAAPVALADDCCPTPKAKPAHCEDAKGHQCDEAKGQCDGSDCETATKVTLAEKLANLAVKAKKGDEEAGAQVAAAAKALGLEDAGKLGLVVAELEGNVAKGCKESHGKLMAMRQAMTSVLPVSKQVAILQIAAKKGCAISAGKLAQLKEAAHAESDEALVAAIGQLEAHAKQGCEESKGTLATLRGKLQATTAPASAPREAAPAKKAAGSCGGCEGAESKKSGGCEGEQAKPKAGGCEGEQGCESGKKQF